MKAIVTTAEMGSWLRGVGRLLPVQEAKKMREAVIDEPLGLTQARRVLILFAASSYIFFLTDIYLGHFLWIQLFVKKFTLSFALIPVFFAPIGLVVSLMAAYKPTPRAVLAFQGVMLVSLLVGLLGTYFHLAPRLVSGTDLFAVRTWLGDPPLLAPAAFALPGIIGLVATFGLVWKKAPAANPSKDADELPKN